VTSTPLESQLTRSVYEILAPCFHIDRYRLITVWQIFTGELPWRGVSPSRVEQLVIRGSRPERPDQDECACLTDRVWQLMEKCWSSDPTARPTASSVFSSVSGWALKGSQADLLSPSAVPEPDLLSPSAVPEPDLRSPSAVLEPDLLLPETDLLLPGFDPLLPEPVAAARTVVPPRKMPLESPSPRLGAVVTATARQSDSELASAMMDSFHRLTGNGSHQEALQAVE
jgi:hypothetical protein